VPIKTRGRGFLEYGVGAVVLAGLVFTVLVLEGYVELPAPATRVFAGVFVGVAFLVLGGSGLARAWLIATRRAPDSRWTRPPWRLLAVAALRVAGVVSIVIGVAVVVDTVT